jgi:heptosyltransferase I
MDWQQLRPRHVLITRLSAIGDCIATIPLAVDVKTLWPECRLTWVVDCGAAALLEPHPDIDQVVRIGKKWLKHPARWPALRQQLRDLHADLVLDPQGLTKSSLLGWLSGARYRIGFDRSHARELAPWLATHRIARTSRHIVDTYRELLAHWCEPEPGEGRFHMPVYADAAQRVERLLAGLGLGGNWLVMNVGAGWPTRIWPTDRFGRLAQRIHKYYGLRTLVVWAGDGELEMAEQVADLADGAAVVAPPTSLTELAEILRRASLVVTSDTGPAHLTGAIGTPCVGLFGPTWGDETGPYGQQHRIVQSIVLPQRRGFQRRGEPVAMQAIPVEEVFDACADLLEAGQLGRASA